MGRRFGSSGREALNFPFTFCRHCDIDIRDLATIPGIFKLDLFGNVDAEIINEMGLSSELETMDDAVLAGTAARCPLRDSSPPSAHQECYIHYLLHYTIHYKKNENLKSTQFPRFPSLASLQKKMRTAKCRQLPHPTHPTANHHPCKQLRRRRRLHNRRARPQLPPCPHELRTTITGVDLERRRRSPPPYGDEGYCPETITRLGFVEPTPNQSQGWPMALKGSDLIGIAETDSEKT
ncbi:hypothetical protein RHSIM_Rhsim05G0171600 [Rhododendron simsii]|uniref:DEAD-box RNA helicase Q domain-containing protein n=1 Tax=Rhododendron simsii TaxID=118357 RepID=A0A834LNM4_RHOSS|nr:hypothetical protein RHSIM_Rhsim05G0171600 [Rhododendron simsii]